MKYNNPMRTVVGDGGPISITTKEFDDRIGNLVATMERVVLWRAPAGLQTLKVIKNRYRSTKS